MPRPTSSGEPQADVEATLRWLLRDEIWPGDAASPLADAFGLALLVSLHRRRPAGGWLDLARAVAGRLTDPPAAAVATSAWALWRLALLDGKPASTAVAQARRVAEAALAQDRPASLFEAWVVCRRIDGAALAREVATLGAQVEALYPQLTLRRDEDLGAMLWATHLYPHEPWARVCRERALEALEGLWVDPPGFFSHLPDFQAVKHAAANHRISIGLSAVGEWPERTWLLSEFFRYYRPEEEEALPSTHILGCCALMPGELLSEG